MKLKETWTKRTWKQKTKRVSKQKSFNPHFLCLHYASYNSISEKADPELCCLVTNVCNLPKTLASQKLTNPLNFFGFESFYGFVIADWTIEPIACLVFYLFIKMWGKRYKKIISKTTKSSKNIEKTSRCHNGNTKKEANIIS